MKLRALLREPLLHFLLLGFALFLWYGRVGPGESDPARIVVTQGQVDAMARQFEATWSRAPTADELRGLVATYVRDEMLYREGLELGFAEDDAVIKRRVRQKYEVMSEELLAMQPPTDAQLQEYLQAHADDFLRPGTVTFQQVLVAEPGPGPGADAAFERAARAVASGADPAAIGMATMLPPDGRDVPLDLVARDFGGQFAGQLAAAPLGTWHGPVASGFGVHLVRVIARTPGSVPPLEAIRVEVQREWERDRRQRALEAHLAGLRRRYEVAIEATLPATDSP